MRPEQVIVTHGNTDFDAFAAMVAAKRLYPQAAILLHGGQNRNVREFASLHCEEIPTLDAARCDLAGVARVVVVETSQLSRLGPVAEVIERPGVEVVLFDHHGEPAPEWVTPGCHVASEDGALASTMVGILAERGIEPTPTEATALALGIHEDTGSLTYTSTTLRDVEALAFCARHGASQELVAAFLHTPLSDEQRALMTTLLDAAETHDAGGTPVLLAAVSWPRYIDAVSTLATKMVDLADCRALVMLVEMEGRVFAVGRSRVPAFDVGAVLERIGGGGHAQAASAIVRDAGLATVRARVADALTAGIAPAPRAGDIMSTPAWFVSEDASIEEAMSECRRRHTSGVQVEGAGVLAGVAEREDLDRAIGHGLAHAPVRAVMSTNVEVVGPDATLAEVQRALLRAPAGRVAVVGRTGAGPFPKEDVVGVVTRSDLLVALGELPAAGPPAASAADVGEQLRALPDAERLWPAVQEAASGFAGVYLVGGAVRDLLLGEPSFDIDLAVEGDGVAFAEALAASLGGRVHPHEKFHTAVVLADALRVDVATARTEHYEYPAALPVVEHASIRRDLFRRDFTINALAVALHAEQFGEVLDVYGGRADLDAGVIRVLHNLSFIEDPTRIFRAVRYENRYGFRMDARTRELARSCVEMGLVGDVSGARVRDELVAMLDEPRVAHSLARLCELGLAQAVHPALDCGRGPAELVERLEDLRAAHAPELPRWRVRLAVLARRLQADDLMVWLEGLRVRRRDAHVIGQAALLPERLHGPLAVAASPSEAAALLDGQALEVALVLAGEAGAAGERALEYLRTLRHVRLEIDGAVLRRELGIPESPLVGDILERLLARKRDGELPSAQDELEVARALAEAPAPGVAR